MLHDFHAQKQDLPDSGEDVGSSISLNGPGRGSQDKANNPDEQADGHALRTTPQIHGLGEGKLGQTADDAGDNRDTSAQRVLSKRTCDIRVQAARDDFGGRGGEVDEPNAVPILARFQIMGSSLLLALVSTYRV